MSSSEKRLVILYKSPISDKAYPETHLKEKAFYKTLTIFANKDFLRFLSSLFLVTNAYLRFNNIQCILSALNWLWLFSKFFSAKDPHFPLAK